MLFNTGLALSQNISFKQYLSNFTPVKLPLDITQEKMEEVAGNPKYISDTVVRKFISPKVYTEFETKYFYHYYACPVANDSITALIYLKTVPVQGEMYLMDIALYNSKNKKLLDRMNISTYYIDLEKENALMDDSTKGYWGEKIIVFSASEIGSDLSITTTSGVFKMTLKGFTVISGRKEEVTD